MGKQTAISVVGGFTAGIAGMLLIACTVAPTPVPVPAPSPTTVIQEDDPNWDCRTMGNQICGVQIQGDWYNVQFHDGSPIGVEAR